MFFRKFLEAKKSNTKALAGAISGEGLLRGLQMEAFCHVLTWQRAKSGSKHSISTFIRALVLFMRVLPSWPTYLPETLLPTTITLEIRCSTCEFGGNMCSP